MIFHRWSANEKLGRSWRKIFLTKIRGVTDFELILVLDIVILNSILTRACFQASISRVVSGTNGLTNTLE